MKGLWTMLLLALPTSGASASVNPYRDPTPGISSYRAEVLAEIRIQEEKVPRLANAVPPPKCTWRPTQDVRPIAELFLHVAAANYTLPRLTGTAALSGFDAQGFEKSSADKDKVLDIAKDSFAPSRKAVMAATRTERLRAAMADSNLDKSTAWFGGKKTERGILVFMTRHTAEHLGESSAYACSIGIVPPRTQDEQREDSHVFDYDQKAPLDIQEVGVAHRGDIAIYDISYASPKGGRVPAYLVVPSGKRPFAAILWGHWYWKNSEFFNRKEFLDEAVALAHAGAVSLLTTGPAARPGHVVDKDFLSDQNMADLVQQVVDMRRGADLLLTRDDVDSNRLAYVGHSYNAAVGGFLSGVDKRFKAFVLMAGDLSNEVDLKSEQFQRIQQKVGPEKFDAFAARYLRLDPGRYISHAAPAVVFMQFAAEENFLTPERVRKYAELVSEPKKFKLYDAPHALNREARRDRIGFLTEQINLSSLSSDLIDAIPDLPQPPTPKP